MPSGVYKRNNKCVNGHLKEGHNLIITSRKRRICRVCVNTSRKRSRHRKGISNEYRDRYADRTGINPFIIGGREYHPLWREIRKLVYKRDNWTCQECGVHCCNNKKINAHHIDYDINNNNFTNLITLCTSCHMKTNFRREHWIDYYRNKTRKDLLLWL
jgi:5-methylcytosine-specific restriction endonuclease McrA